MNPPLPTLLFVHGWAFDAGVWDGVRALLPEWPQAVSDAGYFGSASTPALAGPVVAIGHSQGVQQLLRQLPPDCIGLVSINGFARFTAAVDYPAGVAVRVLDRMLARLDANAEAVVDDFRQRCGAPAAFKHAAPDRTAPTLATIRHAAPHGAHLRAGLQALRDDDLRAALAGAPPMLALAGDIDPIVTPAMTRATFEHTSAQVHWHADGHLLPQSAPDWCAEHIRGFMDRLAAGPTGAP